MPTGRIHRLGPARRWVMAAVFLVFASSAAGFGMHSERAETITLAVRPTVAAPHEFITADGTVSTGEANARVTVQFKQCGLYPTRFRDAAEVLTKEGGEWSASIEPEATGTFRATLGSDVSNQVRVLRRADVRLARTRPGHYRASVVDRVSFWRKHVRIERFDPGRSRWVPLRTVVLGHTFQVYLLSPYIMSSSHEFALNVPVRTRLRAVLPLSQAKPCYAAGYSGVLQPFVGKLGFQLTLRQSGPFNLGPGLCPSVSPQETACIEYTGKGSVRGLGNVSMTYDWLLGLGPPACPATSLAKPLETRGLLRIAGTGTITFTLAAGERCVADDGPAAWLNEPQELTITGGTGRFAGAYGTGTRKQRPIRQLRPFTETWSGTLQVPALEFDLTAPKLHHPRSTTVRAERGAKSARVTFKVTATDGVDGAVPVSCRPGSGSRFPTGKTTVRCKATDSSGNTATAQFTVTVR